MKFFVIKPPQNNEYSAEATNAVFTSLVSKDQSRGLFGMFKSSFPVDTYSFNIISVGQRIFFIVGTSDEKAEHLKNQLFAQYPKADVVEYNDLTHLLKLEPDALVVREITTSRSTAFPILTIDSFTDVDPLASLLSSMARSAHAAALFWLQLIISPAHSSWQKKVQSEISKRSALEVISETKQKEIQSLQEKLKYPGFTVSARLIADTEQNVLLLGNALAILNNGAGNSLKLKKSWFLSSKTLMDAITGHFHKGTAITLNSQELATLWHIPKGTIGIPNIVWGKKLQLDAPENLPVAREGMTDEEKDQLTFIGRTLYKNHETVFGIKTEDRLRHVYIVGKTGTGKSWFIDNMAIEDIRKGHGVAVLDPHGDAIDTIMDYIPKNRVNDVCYMNPADTEYCYPINILEIANPAQRELMVSGIIGIFYKMYSYSWGPRMEHILRNILFTLTYDPNATLPDVMRLLHDEGYRKRLLDSVDDKLIHQFWEMEFAGMSDKFANEAVAPILNKVGQFVTSPLMRRILDRPKSKIRIEELMDNKKILLCDLSQGKIGEDNATLLGSMLITKIQIAAMNRAFQKEEDRVPFYLYVDEFQNFATQSFTKILSEARKYKLGLTLANQYITQIDPLVMGAILGNVGSLTCFNVGAQDAGLLFKEFGSQIEPDDLTSLEQYQMIGRIMIQKVTCPTFTFYALPLPKNKSNHRDTIIEQSRKRYGVRVTSRGNTSLP